MYKGILDTAGNIGFVWRTDNLTRLVFGIWSWDGFWTRSERGRFLVIRRSPTLYHVE
jgi:hypothetical protein